MWGFYRGKGDFLWKFIPGTRMCQVPCSGTDVFEVTLQTRDPAFRLSLLLKTMCWSFCITSFCITSFCTLWELTWCLHCVTSPNPSGCFLTVSCLLQVCQEVVSKCAGILMTEIRHHQNLSPVASSGASTPKQFFSFSLLLSLRGSDTVFYRCTGSATSYYPDLGKSCWSKNEGTSKIKILRKGVILRL